MSAHLFAAKRVDLDRDRLTGPHVRELRLFEHRRHPEITDFNDGKQRLPRLNILPDLNAPAAYDPCYGGSNDRVVEVESRLITAR